MGCFVPDFPYFLFLFAHGFGGHTLLGMFYFDLPVGLAALWLFHFYIKQPSLIFLPGGFRRRLKAGAYSFLPPARLALIAISILVGTATHILWDAFTHRGYWPYEHWSFLRLPVALPILGQSVMYKLLQYISSVAGLVAVAVWIWHWYRTTQPVEHPVAPPYPAAQRFAMVVILPLVAIAGGILRAHEAVRMLHGIRPVANFTADAVITAITILVLELLACGMLLRWRRSDGQVS